MLREDRLDVADVVNRALGGGARDGDKDQNNRQDQTHGQDSGHLRLRGYLNLASPMPTQAWHGALRDKQLLTQAGVTANFLGRQCPVIHGQLVEPALERADLIGKRQLAALL